MKTAWMRHSSARHRGTRASVLAGLCLIAAVGVPVAASARGTSTPAAGTCAVTPNPVAVGSLYTVSGSKLGANRLVSIKVSDTAGTQAGSVMTDATGSATYVGQASVTGSYAVRITDTSRKATLLASCGFSAR